MTPRRTTAGQDATSASSLRVQAGGAVWGMMLTDVTKSHKGFAGPEVCFDQVAGHGALHIHRQVMKNAHCGASR